MTMEVNMVENEGVEEGPLLKILAILVCIVAIIYIFVHDVPVLISKAMDTPSISQTK